MANPLLTEPLQPEHIKPRLLGHWGTSPGLNLVYTHLNRVIRRADLDALCVWGPGHGGPAVLANSWLEGSYSEIYPDVSADAAGMGELFRQFSFPGGVPSHVAPETPGSIHEGGELGYSLAHAYGAAFDNPDLLVACVIGDGEAETGPLAAAWHSNKFLDPVHDGAVLPILHLNGYKIANPTVLSRIPEAELDALLRGIRPRAGPRDRRRPGAGAPAPWPRRSTRHLDRIALIQRTGPRGRRQPSAARWPMIVLRTPKGWTGPAEVDGVPVEGTWRAHQVPLAGVRENPDHLRAVGGLAALVPARGALRRRRPARGRRARLRPRRRPAPRRQPARQRRPAPPRPGPADFRDYAVPVDKPGRRRPSRPGSSATCLRDVMRRTRRSATSGSSARTRPRPTGSAPSSRRPARPGRPTPARSTSTSRPDGRVMEILSEHTCQGWLEGYLLTGRHGLFSCYEAFVAHRRLDGQPARQVAEGDHGSCPGGDPSPRSTTCSPRTSGARTTTASRTRTPASSTTCSTRRPRSSGSTCRRTPTPCCPWPTTACAAATTST